MNLPIWRKSCKYRRAAKTNSYVYNWRFAPEGFAKQRDSSLRQFLRYSHTKQFHMTQAIRGLCLIILLSPCAAQDNTAGSKAIRLDGKRAYGYLIKICRIGPRISGTQGMAKQQELIVRHFEKFPCKVRYQPFEATHPVNGTPVRMNNMIISWHPESKERVLLCCHYDTRPHPDRDRNPFNRRGTFIGANDGASGVALFMEMAHHMHKLRPQLGVDFVLFDGEELVYNERGEYFLGSEFFARQYVASPPPYTYKAGVLFDMIADRSQTFFIEKNSYRYAPDVTTSVWETAQKMGVRNFRARQKHEVRDDHLPLNRIAKIPTTDLIDFDYPYWHTSKDVPSSCSGESIARVGNVICEWLTNGRMPKSTQPAPR